MGHWTSVRILQVMREAAEGAFTVTPLCMPIPSDLYRECWRHFTRC